MQQNLIVMDLDKTVLHCNASFFLGRGMYKRGKIPFFAMMGALVLWFLHKIGLVSTRFMHKKIFDLIFLGQKKTEVEECARALIAQSGINKLFRPKLLEEIFLLKNSLRDKGPVSTALLSISPDFLVQIFADALSVDWWQASEYLVDAEGRFSEVGQIMTGARKGSIIQEWKQGRSGLVYAYTDSLRDWPMLKQATNPICVAPSCFLRLAAWLYGWPVRGGI